MVHRFLSLVVIFSLIFEQAGFAQVAPSFVPGYLSSIMPAEHFCPVHLRSLTFD